MNKPQFGGNIGSNPPGVPDDYTPKAIDVSIPVPDRASVEPDSPHFAALQGRSIGIKFDGKLRPNDVIEFCTSEGWIRIAAKLPNGKVRKERGKRVLVKLTGAVEAFWRN